MAVLKVVQLIHNNGAIMMIEQWLTAYLLMTLLIETIMIVVLHGILRIMEAKLGTIWIR